MLLGAGASVAAKGHYAIWMASMHGHAEATARLLGAGGKVGRIDWSKFDRLDQLRILAALPRDQFFALSPARRSLWLRTLLPAILRLQRAYHRARYRLDRPPTEPLGDGRPTRETLIKHLQTGGRRFARDYWAEGIPLFFPDSDFGPVPDCFLP